MSEADVVNTSDGPRTTASLLADLAALGVAPGNVLLVHASLSRLGWVAGGAQAAVAALCDSVGPGGTLVMPTHSTHLTDPAHWQAPPVPADWVQTIRQGFPGYDPARTPTRGMGAMAELFRSWPGVRRSSHPHYSMAALGPLAETIVGRHPLEHGFDDHSPLGRLYDADAQILLLGVGFDSCTMLHLADERVWPDRPLEQDGAPILRHGHAQWVTYQTRLALDPDRFVPFGAGLVEQGLARLGPVGSAEALLMRAQPLVDAAIAAWRGLPLPA